MIIVFWQVMEAVCVMLDLKPERKPDPSGSGKMVEDFWTPSQKLLGDMKFLQNLLLYDKENIPTKIISHVRNKYGILQTLEECMLLYITYYLD